VAILVACQCGQQFQTKDENAGRRAQCPDCGRELVVPKPGLVPGDDFAAMEPTGTITSDKAIASFVLGLCVFCLAFTGLLAILLGALGLSDIHRSKGRVRGSFLAIAGIVLGVVSVLLTPVALYPAVQSARESSRRAQCVNNLKQIGLAMFNFLSAETHFPAPAIVDKEGRPLLSWRVAILPFLGPEETSLFRRFRLDEPWDSPHNIALLNEMPRVYACPSVPNLRAGLTTYQVFVGPGTIFPGGKPVAIQDVLDGTSNTLLVVEAQNPVPWTAPQDIPFNMSLPATGIGSDHPGGFNAGFADGSVRFLKDTINPTVLRSLITRASGEVISASSF
jgi:prepilin-type processing-associated H-X9-DG protein